MKKLLLLCALLPLAIYAHADEVKRDACGKIVQTTTKNPDGSETVRGGSGKIIRAETKR